MTRGKPTGCGKGAVDGLTSVSRCCERLYLNSLRPLASFYHLGAKFSPSGSLTCPRSGCVCSHAWGWKSLSASLPLPLLWPHFLYYFRVRTTVSSCHFSSLLLLPPKIKSKEAEWWWCCSVSGKDAATHNLLCFWLCTAPAWNWEATCLWLLHTSDLITSDTIWSTSFIIDTVPTVCKSYQAIVSRLVPGLWPTVLSKLLTATCTLSFLLWIVIKMFLSIVITYFMSHFSHNFFFSYTN